MTKFTYGLVLASLLFSACSDSEKEKVVNAVQEINIRDNVEAKTITSLDQNISETSGLAFIDDVLWTHNDSGGEAKLYAIDRSNGSILRTVDVNNTSNVDWEDLAFNETHLFIGDFGNNKGIRKDLKIYSIKREDLKTQSSVEAEVIEFSYATQTDFNATSKTNYDCEAFIVYEDNFYLFSKNYGDNQTDMYRLGMDSSTGIAEKVSSFQSNALVTGASIDSESKTLALIGYKTNGTPKSWIFSNFVDADFFKGEQRKINWGTPAKAQIEGVTHMKKGMLYISSENFDYSDNLGSFSLKQTLYGLDY